MQNWIIVSSLSAVLVTGVYDAPLPLGWHCQNYAEQCVFYNDNNRVAQFEYQGHKFAFKNRELFDIFKTNDGYHIYDKDLAIDLYADNLQELQQDLNFILEDNIDNYVKMPDDKLASDALRLKRNMLAKIIA